MLPGRVAGTIVGNEFGTRAAAKGMDKIVGAPLMQSEDRDQLTGDRLRICPAVRSGASRLEK